MKPGANTVRSWRRLSAVKEVSTLDSEKQRKRRIRGYIQLAQLFEDAAFAEIIEQKLRRAMKNARKRDRQEAIEALRRAAGPQGV